jgi:hypothetical protein
MINVEALADDTLRLEVVGTLDTGDFEKITGYFNSLVTRHGSINLLIDARDFNGWSSANAAASHFNFVRDHSDKVERIAILAGHEWQHWVAAVAGVFVHPSIKVFDKNEELRATHWLGLREAAA